MKGCREFEQLMDRARRDTASEEEREILLDHLESCRDCSTVFEALGRLAETDSFPEPTETETLSVRRAVIRKIRRRQVSGEPRPSDMGRSMRPNAIESIDKDPIKSIQYVDDPGSASGVRRGGR